MAIKPKLLITGASGLLAHEFIEKYYHRYEIFAQTHSKKNQQSKHIRYIEIDFSMDWGTECLPRQVDFVVHLAQSPKFRNFPESALEVFNVNLLSTMKLLDYALRAKVQKFVLASTGGIYGSSTFPISTHSEILGPTGLNQYFGSKLAAEIFSNNYRDYFSIDINRIFFMYGPRQSRAMLIPRLIDSVIGGNIIQLAGPDGILINPIYVTDVAKFLSIQLEDSDSRVYNVAGAENVSIKELVGIIEKEVGKSANYEIVSPATNIVADASEFLSKLNSQTIPISNGIKLCMGNQTF